MPTGSRIAYTLLPAKGPKKAYPIIYLLGGPGGWVDETVVRMMTPLTAEGYDVYLYDQVGSGWSERLADIREFEQVAVVDVDNGNRFVTYVIEGKPGSGVICVNGAAARLVSVGDRVIIMAYGQCTREEAREFRPRVVLVSDSNGIKDAYELSPGAIGGFEARPISRLRRLATHHATAVGVGHLQRGD